MLFSYIALLILPFGTNAERSAVLTSGYWYNPFSNRQIEIVSYPDGIKVNGIHNKFGWSWFDKIGSSTYRDVFGNKIRQTAKYELIYTNRNKSERLTFRWFKTVNGYDRSYPYRHADDEAAADDYYSPKAEDAKSNYGQYKAGDKQDLINSKNGSGSGFLRMEGTWQVNDLSKKVFIAETREGIKARFIDESKWFVFTKQGLENIFVSESGHQYELFATGELVWSDKERKRKFYLSKISDELTD
jgi:hypothetical protein